MSTGIQQQRISLLSWKKGKPLAIGYDLNSLPDSGHYDVRSPTNGPAGGDFHILNLVGSQATPQNQLTTQIAVNMATGNMYTRVLSGSSWSAWTLLGGGADDQTAAEVPFTPVGSIAATDVQTAIQELDTEKASTGSVATVASDLSNHIADASDAHDATAVSFTPTGSIAATNVQAAIEELDTDKATTGSVTTVSNDLAAHIADGIDAHDASAISFVPAGGVVATDVQAAIDEVVTKVNPNVVTDADYAVIQGDAGKLTEMSSAAVHNVNVPLNATTAIAIRSRYDFVQIGAGAVTFVPEVGVTLISLGGNKVLSGQGAGATLYKRATDVWVLVGGLIA